MSWSSKLYSGHCLHLLLLASRDSPGCWACALGKFCLGCWSGTLLIRVDLLFAKEDAECNSQQENHSVDTHFSLIAAYYATNSHLDKGPRAD